MGSSPWFIWQPFTLDALPDARGVLSQTIILPLAKQMCSPPHYWRDLFIFTIVILKKQTNKKTLIVSKRTHRKCCLFRKDKLQEAHQLQLFKANQRLLLEWSLKQSSEMAEKGLPKTRTEADRLIIEHQDWRVSIMDYLHFTTKVTADY